MKQHHALTLLIVAVAGYFLYKYYFPQGAEAAALSSASGAPKIITP